MTLAGRLVLPPDVLLVPVARLAAGVRRRLGGEAGEEWALTRPRARLTSRLVDASAAALLEQFRAPRTIVEAVLAYSRAHGRDPEGVFAEAFPLLDHLVEVGLLCPEGEAAILPSFAAGDEVAGCRILACLQSLDDTEVYQVRGAASAAARRKAAALQVAALKIERRGGPAESGGDLLAREAVLLAHFGGGAAPRLLATGEHAGRRWLLVEWCPGADAAAAAAELRRSADRPGLLALCRAVAAAYADLHGRGVLHGDVHPGNVLVDAGSAVRLIDFGLAHGDGGAGGLPRAWRGGLPFFQEPELAAAARAGGEEPGLSPAGEQYSVAALLYLLFAGAHSADFSLAKDEMLRQIAEEPPLPFAARGAEPWPEVEAVLARALAKDPRRRFPALADLAAALGAIALPAPAARGGRTALPVAPRLDSLLARVLERVGADGPLWRSGLAPPRASLHFGAAGIAFALYRIALAREDAGLLSLAELWSARAGQAREEEDFYSRPLGITPESVGRVSPYHTPTGPFCVAAVLAHAAGEPGDWSRAVLGFARAARGPCPEADLTLGRSGLLLATAILLALARSGSLTPGPLLGLGQDLLAGLWRELDLLPPIPGCDERPNLGMAHGWAGYLYASLRWCRAAGSPWPGRLAERLAELADCAEPWRRGLRWRWYGGEAGERRDAGMMPGWCNGSAGFVHLFTLAHEVAGEPLYRRLAEGAAWNAWEAPDGIGSLCCGLAGRAYALLNLHRHGGGAVWLTRARELAEGAAADLAWAEESPDSLYRGEIGPAVLAADLARPEWAAMPFFEDEGWPA